MTSDENGFQFHSRYRVSVMAWLANVSESDEFPVVSRVNRTDERSKGFVIVCHQNSYSDEKTTSYDLKSQ